MHIGGGGGGGRGGGPCGDDDSDGDGAVELLMVMVMVLLSYGMCGSTSVAAAGHVCVLQVVAGCGSGLLPHGFGVVLSGSDGTRRHAPGCSSGLCAALQVTVPLWQQRAGCHCSES